MRINVLGPVQLLDRSPTLPAVGGARRRALLAALLLHLNRPVPRSRLVEAVWEDHPPRSAAANIRTYAADLRRALGPTADGRVRVVGDRLGYSLRVGTGELDLLDFQVRADAGRAALRDRDLERAESLLGAAVGLWRGRAFEDVELRSWAESAVGVLEERRWSVLCSWVDVRTALRRFDDLDVRLREMVSERPLAERAWARLMHVLESTERRSEAVAVFAEATAVLWDALGTEPGPELRAVHDRIRPGSSSAHRRVRPAATAERDVVSTLPAVAGVVGRVEVVADVRRLLCAPRGPVGVALSGLAGAGKTAVALQVAAELEERFPDGRFYLGLGGPHPESPTDALGTLLACLGVPSADLPTGPGARAHLFRLLVARRSVLVVLDDVSDSAQVGPLLPGVGRSRVLVAGRRRLAGLVGMELRHLGPMRLADARRVLESLVGEERVRREPKAAEALVRACGGTPAALRIVATRLLVRPDQPLAALASRLTDPSVRLDELVAGDYSVRDALVASCAELTAEERFAAQLLASAGPRLLTTESIVRILSMPPGRADLVIEGLICANVLIAVDAAIDPPRYHLDELVALHLREVAAAHRSPRRGAGGPATSR